MGTSAGVMPTKARGNYLLEPPYLRETKIYHSQPLESIRHAGNYFVPISIRPIFIYFLLQKLCQITWLLTGWKIFLYFRRPPWGLKPVAFATSATWLIRHWWAVVDNVVHGLSLATITGRWLDDTPFVQVSMTWALTCPETVPHRPCTTAEIENWLS